MPTAVNSKEVTRHQNIDIAKGLLIFFVVLGHSGTIVKDYIYWFHMPVFFIISGLFYKPQNSFDDYKRSMKDLTRYMITPYIMYLLVINCYQVSHLLLINNFNGVKQYVYNLIYGGRRLVKENGIFWFISVLYITRALLGFLSLYFNKKNIALIVLFMFFLATLESIIFKRSYIRDFPLNVDVVLMSSFFYYTGFLISPHLSKIKVSYIVISLLLYIVLILSAKSGIINFSLDMKYSMYDNAALVIIIPAACFLVILGLSNVITKIKILKDILSYMGKNSLSIMYLHLPLNILLANLLLFNHNVILFVLTGITLPLAIGELLKLNRYTKQLFIGK